MKNRGQIYGQEAAGLLRNITVYHCILYIILHWIPYRLQWH